MISFTAQVYETEIQTQLWNVNLNFETVISNGNIWNVYPMKIRDLPLFQFATRLNSQNQCMTLILRLNS